MEMYRQHSGGSVKPPNGLGQPTHRNAHAPSPGPRPGEWGNHANHADHSNHTEHSGQQQQPTPPDHTNHIDPNPRYTEGRGFELDPDETTISDVISEHTFPVPPRLPTPNNFRFGDSDGFCHFRRIWGGPQNVCVPNGANVFKSGPFLPLFRILSVPPDISAVFKSG